MFGVLLARWTVLIQHKFIRHRDDITLCFVVAVVADAAFHNRVLHFAFFSSHMIPFIFYVLRLHSSFSNGLPSEALAKDGADTENRTRDPLLTMQMLCL